MTKRTKADVAAKAKKIGPPPASAMAWNARALKHGLVGDPKPKFVEGQAIRFQIHGYWGDGFIRGVVSKGIVDIWIIQVLTFPGEPEALEKYPYPFSCITLPHTQIGPGVLCPLCKKAIVPPACQRCTPCYAKVRKAEYSSR